MKGHNKYKNQFNDNVQNKNFTFYFAVFAAEIDADTMQARRTRMSVLTVRD